MIKLSDIIKEILDEDSKLADQAKSLGLTNMGFGRWGKNGKVTHHSDGERLVPKDPKAKLNPSKEVPQTTGKSLDKKPDMSNKPKSNSVGASVGTNQKKQTSGDDSPVVSVKPSNKYMGDKPSLPKTSLAAIAKPQPKNAPKNDKDPFASMNLFDKSRDNAKKK